MTIVLPICLLLNMTVIVIVSHVELTSRNTACEMYYIMFYKTVNTLYISEIWINSKSGAKYTKDLCLPNMVS